MQASVVDLRYRMKRVLKALEMREPVTVLYRGKVKATIMPVKKGSNFVARKHPTFGMWARDKRPVIKVMEGLRGGRFRDL
jgi:antitoxin (DNA-binding transcriptional repressor) of toxin-antitoxin stability system